MRVFVFSLALLIVGGCTATGDPGETTAANEPVTTIPTTTLATTTTMATAPSTVVATTTTTTTTTTAPPATTPTTTTAAGGPYLVGVPELFPPTPLPGSDGAAGSGCSPGAGPLPDGVWFGYVVAKSATTIDFDLSCFYFGDIAYTEGAEDGEEVNNDYYVRNVNPTIRTIPIASAAIVYEIDATGPSDFLDVPFSGWPTNPSGYVACPSDFCGVWLFVNGGDVTEMLEQYVP